MSFSQKNEKRLYKISVINQPQTIELIEYKNGNYSGNVITEITKGKWKRDWLNRAWRNICNIKDKEIVEKSSIDQAVVKELMTELEENGIEKIKKCSDDEKCDKVRFLDGKIVRFNIRTNGIDREYVFQEIYPLNEKNKDPIELRLKVQNLISIIYKHIDLKQNLSNFFKHLPKGYYHWYQSGGHIITRKNKKHRK